MIVPILIFDMALVAWSMHLMQKAVEDQEFSLMLAGFLVVAAAGAMLVAYFMMGPCITYFTGQGFS
ncbi:MAG: hypothetical protein HC796_01545 [Synechococcaceae cyanobacterium RL_1_2]|jgi:hypothetical protein|nr:hypothetical protein [Synechococcaceae cyanobacterium RL_1_2]